MVATSAAAMACRVWVRLAVKMSQLLWVVVATLHAAMQGARRVDAPRHSAHATAAVHTTRHCSAPAVRCAVCSVLNHAPNHALTTYQHSPGR